jgi:hypothetical protein
VRHAATVVNVVGVVGVFGDGVYVDGVQLSQ